MEREEVDRLREKDGRLRLEVGSVKEGMEIEGVGEGRLLDGRVRVGVDRDILVVSVKLEIVVLVVEPELSGSPRVEVGRARVGVGKAKIGVGRVTIGVGRVRVGLGRAGVGVGWARVGLGRARFGLGRARVEVGRDRVELCRDRVGL